MYKTGIRSNSVSLFLYIVIREYCGGSLHPYHLCKRNWHWCCEVHVLTCGRMNEAKGLCVKRHAMYWRTLCSVTSVTGYWMTEVLHVYSYLVFSSSVKRNFHQRVAIAALQGFIAGNSKLPFLGVIGGIDFKTRVFSKIAPYFSLCWFRSPFDYGKIFARQHHIVPIVL